MTENTGFAICSLSNKNSYKKGKKLMKNRQN